MQCVITSQALKKAPTEKPEAGYYSEKSTYMSRNRKRNIPFWTSSSRSPIHSFRKRLAPVRLPSPPITHRLVMPKRAKLQAAFRRPSRLRKALQRALPMMVPPWKGHKSCSLTGKSDGSAQAVIHDTYRTFHGVSSFSSRASVYFKVWVSYF